MTKKTFLLVLICAMTTTVDKSFAQNYLSLFGENSTTWDIVVNGYCDALCSQTITTNSDTAVNGNVYRTITGLPGFLREDTVQGKAWFYNTDYNVEYLVMDLGLTLGENFIIYDFSNTANPFVVDSVYYLNSKKHVRLNAWTKMCALNEKITFIEGSGTTASFHYQRDLNGDHVSSSMLCHHKDGVRVTGNTLFNDLCYECFVGIEENNLASFKVNLFPNPSTDQVQIDLGSTIAITMINTYNSLGELVHTEKRMATGLFDYILPKQEGVYLIQLVHGDGNFTNLKVVKE